MSKVRIIGRSSSHFTRVTRIFAAELGVAYELVPVLDMTRVDAEGYADNPVLKVPSLERDGARLFGTANICRALAELGDPGVRVVWPEALRADVARNADELVWHGMAAEVQLVFGTVVAKLPADNVYFAKGRAGFVGALDWLEGHLDDVLRALPPERDLSLLEAALFCLVDHIAFRGTLPLEPYPNLVRFRDAFAARPSAASTPYRFDA